MILCFKWTYLLLVKYLRSLLGTGSELSFWGEAWAVFVHQTQKCVSHRPKGASAGFSVTSKLPVDHMGLQPTELVPLWPTMPSLALKLGCLNFAKPVSHHFYLNQGAPFNRNFHRFPGQDIGASFICDSSSGDRVRREISFLCWKFMTCPPPWFFSDSLLDIWQEISSHTYIFFHNVFILFCFVLKADRNGQREVLPPTGLSLIC